MARRYDSRILSPLPRRVALADERGQGWRVVLLLAFSVALVFGAAMTASLHFPLWERLAAGRAAEAAAPIEIGALGSTPGELRKLHANLVLDRNSAGLVVGTFATRDGLHTVWFSGEEGEERAFRVRFDGSFRMAGEDEVYAFLARHFGRPLVEDCQRGAVANRGFCRFRWWVPDSILLHADASFQSRVVGGGVDLALVAMDTRMDGHRRVAAATIR